MSLAVVFSNLAGFVGTNFSATKESRYYFTTSFWSGLLCLVLNFLLIPLYGIWGMHCILAALEHTDVLFKVRKTKAYSPITNVGLCLQLLLVVGGYIALFYWTESHLAHTLGLLVALVVVILLNKDFLSEAYSIGKKLIKK